MNVRAECIYTDIGLFFDRLVNDVVSARVLCLLNRILQVTQSRQFLLQVDVA